MKKIALKVMPFVVRWGSLALMVFAIYTFVNNTFFWVRAEATTGTVLYQEKTNAADASGLSTDVEDRLRRNQVATYAPYITFKTSANEDVTFLSNIGYDKNFAFEKGDKVSVLYLSSNPQTAQVYSLFEMFGLPIVLFLFAGVFWGGSMLFQAMAEGSGKDNKSGGSEV